MQTPCTASTGTHGVVDSFSSWMITNQTQRWHSSDNGRTRCTLQLQRKATVVNHAHIEAGVGGGSVQRSAAISLSASQVDRGTGLVSDEACHVKKHAPWNGCNKLRPATDPQPCIPTASPAPPFTFRTRKSPFFLRRASRRASRTPAADARPGRGRAVAP